MDDWGDDNVETVASESEPPAQDEDADSAPRLVYGNADEFFREYLRYVYRRRIDGRNRLWSRRWWAYDEALNRVEALWRAWEALRLDPATGMSVWWRDHADPHMSMLMSPDGPFQGCDDKTTAPNAPLPYEAPPEGFFVDEREAR